MERRAKIQSLSSLSLLLLDIGKCLHACGHCEDFGTLENLEIYEYW